MEPQHNKPGSIRENVQVTEVRGQADNFFHFPLENVIDIMERNQIDTFRMVPHIKEYNPILEPIQPSNTSRFATSHVVSTQALIHVLSIGVS
jgi:hypothetical protein